MYVYCSDEETVELYRVKIQRALNNPEIAAELVRLCGSELNTCSYRTNVFGIINSEIINLRRYLTLPMSQRALEVPFQFPVQPLSLLPIGTVLPEVNLGLLPELNEATTLSNIDKMLQV